MCSHLHFRLAQSQRSPSQSSHHKHPLCVSLRGTAHTHTQEEEGWREAPPPVHLPPKSSTLTSGPWEEKPTQGLAERAHTHTQLHRALCGPLQLYANSPPPSRSLAAAFALPGENPRTLPRTGARRGRCWPPLSPCLRRNPDGRAGRPHVPGGGGGTSRHHRCFHRPGRSERAAAAAAAPPRGRPHLLAAGGGARPVRGTELPAPWRRRSSRRPPSPQARGGERRGEGRVCPGAA